MDWEFFGVVATLTSATVVLALTWAVTQRIMADTKKRMLRSPEPESQEPTDQILSTLKEMEGRLGRLENRLDFTERLLEGPGDDPHETR